MNRTEAQTASAAFVRSLDLHAQRLWEARGPLNTDIWRLEAWTLTVPGDRPRVVVVQIFGARNDDHAGWMTLAEVGPNDIQGTALAFRRLSEIEGPELTADHSALMLRTLKTLLADFASPQTVESVRRGPHVALLQQVIGEVEHG